MTKFFSIPLTVVAVASIIAVGNAEGGLRVPDVSAEPLHERRLQEDNLKCGKQIVNRACEGIAKPWKDGWGNGSQKKANGDIVLKGHAVNGQCTILAGPLADVVAKTVPKWAGDAAEPVCADLCASNPGSGFCTGFPTLDEVCEIEPFLEKCPVPKDDCGIKILNNICGGGKVKTWEKDWGNGSQKKANGDLKIKGKAVSGTCDILAGPMADAMEKLVPKWTPNPNDRRRLGEVESVCGYFCEANPELSSFCTGEPTKDDICAVEPFLEACPPKIDTCGIEMMKKACGKVQIKTWKKNWGNGSQKLANGDLKIKGSSVSGTCTILAGPIADAVEKVIPKWTPNPNDRRHLEEEEEEPVCAALCEEYPDSGFCNGSPTQEDVCAVEPFLAVCPADTSKCGKKIAQIACDNKVQTWKQGWGNGSQKLDDGGLKIKGSGVSGTCEIVAGPIADAVEKVVPKWTANPNDRRQLEDEACASLCDAYPGSGFCGDQPTKEEICEASPFLSSCPAPKDKCGNKLLSIVCPNKVRYWKTNWGNGSEKLDNGDLKIKGRKVSGKCTVAAGPIADALAKIVPKWTANPNDRRHLEASVCADLCTTYPGSGFCNEEPDRTEICEKEPNLEICQTLNKRKNQGHRQKPVSKKQAELTRVAGQCVADHQCASMRGDPHFVSFDGKKFDCQGAGEFVLAKSLDSAFEIQGRFEDVGKSSRAVSITKAVSIDTGVEGAPQFDAFTEEVDGECVMNYYVDGVAADFGENGTAIDGIEFMPDVDVGARQPVDFIFFTGSAIMYSVYSRQGKFSCVMDNKFCLPPKLVNQERIIGLLGSPNGNPNDEWMNPAGATLPFQKGGQQAYDYCTKNWCVDRPQDSIFGYLPGTQWSDYNKCSDSFDPSGEDLVASASPECLSCCAGVADEFDNKACLLECMEGDTGECKAEIENESKLADLEKKCPDPDGEPAEDRSGEEDTDKKAYCEMLEDSDLPFKTEYSGFLSMAMKEGDKLPGDSVELDGVEYTLSDKCSLVPVIVPTEAPVPTPAPTEPYSCVDESDMPEPAKNLYEFALMGKDFYPTCGEIGQNEAFQGQDLIVTKGNQDPECVRVNICHGNAGFGWNRITVDRDAIGVDNNGHGGHAKEEHNDPDKPKRPDFFPGSYSVPNPNGAGKNGYLDSMCNFVPACPEDGGAPPPVVPGLAPPKETDPPATTNPPAPDELTPEDRTTDDGYVKGDPHFKTFGGEMYDFHGECDLVLLHNPDFKNGLGMDIHIRTKIEDFWSSVQSSALLIGESTMEIQANPDSNEWLWVNGEVVSTGIEMGQWNQHSIAGFKIRFKESTVRAGVIREANVYLEGSKEFLIFKAYRNFVKVDISWKESQNYDNSLGLLGSHAHNGQRLARDGESFIEDVNQFGQEWQVLDSEPKLFHSYEGAVVGDKCIMPPSWDDEDAPQVQLRKRRLAESNMTEADATKACSHLQDQKEIKACVYDVLATQNLDMAAVW